MNLRNAHLEGACQSRAFFDAGIYVRHTSLASREYGAVKIADVRWGGANLANVEWVGCSMLGEEQDARQKFTARGEKKSGRNRRDEYETAVRANRQFATTLREQGLNEQADHFAYCAQACQREALRALQLWGLVEARQGGGNYVCAPSIEQITTPLSTIIEHNRQLQDELMDARLIFEPAICWLAAQRRTEHDLDAIEAILERQRRGVERGDLAVEEDSAFHLALAEATHNQVVPRLIATINDLLLESRLRSLRTPDRPRRSLEGHLRIAAAMHAGDADAARQAMHDHIAAIADILRVARTHSA